MIHVIITFLSWTLLLYVIHRTIHIHGRKWFPISYKAHNDHHKYINVTGGTQWHWNNCFLFNDTWLSTLDLWITEVIPTLIFSYITGEWWISIAYYFWAAFLQEVIEHNPKFSWYPAITSGKWHLVHHEQPYKNYGLFVPFWDLLFGSYKMYSK